MLEYLQPPSHPWRTVAHPGYLGSRKDEQFAQWNQDFPEGWRLVWELANGDILEDYAEVVCRLYVPGYSWYFWQRPEEAAFLTHNYAYTYDKTPINRAEAFNTRSLCGVPGVPNQFHHVALNVALVYSLGLDFQGDEPLQVRDGSPWSPGLIPTVRPDLIPDIQLEGPCWWEPGTIEDLYQKAKVLQVR